MLLFNYGQIMNKLPLANLPTRIQRLNRWSAECGKNIYIKRDDQTGSEWSGNKVRKLEFAVQEALSQGCDLLITCGGIQSNHCRATVSVATYLGLKSAVLLRISEQPPLEGNYFLDKLLRRTDATKWFYDCHIILLIHLKLSDTIFEEGHNLIGSSKACIDIGLSGLRTHLLRSGKITVSKFGNKVCISIRLDVSNILEVSALLHKSHK